jgi:lysozyme family protein
MKEDWNDAINFVLKMEGGYTVDPNDPGGETNFGISKKAYPNLDIKDMTVDQAEAIYQSDYWAPCSCDDLPKPLALSVFDCAVNQGVTKAKRILQMALGVEVDGNVGPETIAAAMKSGPQQVKLYLADRLAEYSRIMADNPKLLVFAQNWAFRVVSLAELIL